jgi:hypothetical protein
MFFPEAYCGLDYPLLPMRFFLNVKWDAIVVCSTVGAMVFYSMNIMWPNLVAALYTTHEMEVGWLSVCIAKVQALKKIFF